MKPCLVIFKYVFFFWCFLICIRVSAQIGDQNGFNAPLESTDPDSLTAQDSVIVKNAFFKLFTGKPGRAALYSLIIPGGGQLYNKKYWKFPIAVGIDGALAYNVWYQTREYNEFQGKYITALKTGDTDVLIYKENRDQFRRAKEFGWLYLVLGHLLTTIDAYVDRHLMDFDISPDITYTFPGHQPTIGLNICFNLNQYSFKNK